MPTRRRPPTIHRPPAAARVRAPSAAAGTAGTDALAAELRQVVGADHVLSDPSLRAGYEVDWTRRFRGSAALVVRPRTTEEVAAVVALCARHRVPLVPQGGNTGLVGGGVPRGGEVVLSLARLDRLEEVDSAALDVEAGAGVTLGHLQSHAAAAGLAFGIDFAARDTATVGGMIATNAGGVHVLRYGSMRAQVRGLEAVLADGSIVSRLDAPGKDAAGYALPSLLAGSEGTLGVITRARLRLVPTWRHRAVALVALRPSDPTLAEAQAFSPHARATMSAVSLAGRIRSRMDCLEAAELFFDDGLALVLRHRTGEPPFARPSPAYLLLECAADRDPADELADALADAPEVDDAVLATDTAACRRLWDLREAHTEAIAAEGIPHKLDVSAPVRRLAELVARLPAVIEETAGPGVRLIAFGHVGDGNLHVNLLGPAPEDERADEAVLRLVASLGGSISGEHGVGVAKRRWLGLTRSAADISAMRAIKLALDPLGILNPGVLFEP